MAKAKVVAVPAKEKIMTASIKVKKDKKSPKVAEKKDKKEHIKSDKVKKENEKSDKEILKEEISSTLQKTFTDIKKAVGEKKFNKHVKKATKALAGGASKKIKEVKKDKTVNKD